MSDSRRTIHILWFYCHLPQTILMILHLWFNATLKACWYSGKTRSNGNIIKINRKKKDTTETSPEIISFLTWLIMRRMTSSKIQISHFCAEAFIGKVIFYVCYRSMNHLERVMEPPESLLLVEIPYWPSPQPDPLWILQLCAE